MNGCLRCRDEAPAAIGYAAKTIDFVIAVGLIPFALLALPAIIVVWLIGEAKEFRRGKLA